MNELNHTESSPSPASTTNSHNNYEQIDEDDLLWQHLKSLPAFRAVLRAIEARFYHMIDLPEPVLDVGCGDGNFAELTFNRRGRKLNIGLDPWWNPLKKSVEAGIYDLALQGMGDEMPFPDGHFSSAISNSVLEHIPDIQPVLNETGRVMKMGGQFIMTMPNHQFTQRLWGAELFEKLGFDKGAELYRGFFNFISRHAHTRSVEWWGARLAEAGFTISRWQYYFSPEALHALEFGHAQGVPSAVLHAFTNQWILLPTRSNLGWVDRWLRPFYLEQASLEGTYLFIVATKVANDPIELQIPEAQPFIVDEFGDLIPDNYVPAEEEAAPAPVLAASPAGITECDEDSEVIEDHELDSNDIWAGVFEKIKPRPLAAGLSAAGLILALVASGIGNTTNTARPFLAIFVWLLAIGGTTFGLWQATDRFSTESGVDTIAESAMLGWFRPAWVVASLLTLLAWLLRVYQLAEFPFVLSGTESNIGIEAWQAITGQWRNPFSTAAITNPVLPFYVIGLPLRIFGRTAFALRLMSTLVGALTVGATYWMGQKLWRPSVGLAAAVLMLGAQTHLHYSRLGMTNIWDPLMVLLALGFFALAWQDDRRLWWLLFGASAGFSAYFFTASRLLPLVIGLILIWLLVIDPVMIWRNIRHLVAAAVLTLVIALPMWRFYSANETIFPERLNQYGVLQSGWMESEAVRSGQTVNALWGTQIWNSVTAFYGADDSSTYFNIDGGLFSLWPALLLLAGFCIAVWRLQELRYAVLALWLINTIVFGGAYLIDPPASHRYVVVIPAVCLLAAVALMDGLTALSGRLGQRQPDFAKAFIRYEMIIVLVLSMAIIAPESINYFSDYRQNGMFADRNTEIAHRVADYLQVQDPAESVVYFHGPPFMYTDFPTIRFLNSEFIRGVNLLDVENPASELPPISAGKRTIFVFVPERQDDINAIEEAFPGGERVTFVGEYADPLFLVYELRR